MQEVEQWLDHPVTETFFRSIQERRDQCYESKAGVNADSPNELFRLYWWFQGGVDELDALLDLGDKDADAIEEYFGGDDDE